MGGEGFAEPAGTCSLTYPFTFFAMSQYLLGPSALHKESSPSERYCFNYGNRPRPRGLRQCPLGLLHLREVQLNGRRAPENLYGHLQPVFLVVDTLNHAIEVVERSIDDAHHLAGLEEHLG